jgi:transposase
MDLTDQQWGVVKPLIPVPPCRPDGRGRPRINDRDVLNGMLWIMLTGAPWHDMPDRYAPYQTSRVPFRQ